ncbi:1-hydroxycarotenoid 3,4-desaturase CrtD [Afifella pfennigii]|uniref:1-hydroxycarotenoid 3,4-desaturase CrtD n=1 Tax=Afifella pfennigii TaxID=209897 RepID=UPI000478B8A0|nr:1-hydroxycarotenoid 3,4-desaturase CrtD [Afifella pfennigii]
MRTQKVIVVGAGIGGLVAALRLAAAGADVTLMEKEKAPGGKMREVAVGHARIDGGPTVFTMRPLFEEIFAAAGLSMEAELAVKPAHILARHAWSEDERLDLFADMEASAEAIGAFAGPEEARGYLRFCARAKRIFETLEEPFIRAARPSVASLIRRAGLAGLPGLMQISPFTTLWQELGRFFKDERLRQLFGRYSTYCGSSPFLSPATLMLIAHVEQEGVWLVEGGMHQVAATLARLAGERGAQIRYGEAVGEIVVENGAARGVRLASGERLQADAIVLNADVAALAGGHFGADAASAIRLPGGAERSLSALTFCLLAETEGFPLIRHNVFFSRDYAGEFEAIFKAGELPEVPTVYVCAQDRDDAADRPAGPERLFILVNAPARGDRRPLEVEEIARCEERTLALMERCGLKFQGPAAAKVLTGPNEFERLFPATGGALYGQASHGWKASFERLGATTRLPGLYLAGGSVHPGAGVPMAALSGHMAAERLLSDFASTPR